MIGTTSNNAVPLLPLYHGARKAQLNIILDGDGHFLRALAIPKEDSLTICPVTEDSDIRTKNVEPHPLFDTLQYIAGD